LSDTWKETRYAIADLEDATSPGDRIHDLDAARRVMHQPNADCNSGRIANAISCFSRGAKHSNAKHSATYADGDAHANISPGHAGSDSNAVPGITYANRHRSRNGDHHSGRSQT
jgi:hypothetical protein